MKKEDIPSLAANGAFTLERLLEIVPDELQLNLFFAVLAQTMSSMSEARFQALLKTRPEPCDEPGCNCHLAGQQLHDLLVVFRHNMKETDKKAAREEAEEDFRDGFGCN